MLPDEVYILNKISLDKKWPFRLEKSHDIPGEYIGYLIISFLKRGLIRRDWSGGYHLTTSGKRHFPYCQKNQEQ